MSLNDIIDGCAQNHNKVLSDEEKKALKEFLIENPRLIWVFKKRY